MRLCLKPSGVFLFFSASLGINLGCFVPPTPPQEVNEIPHRVRPVFQFVSVEGQLDFHLRLETSVATANSDARIDLLVHDDDSPEVAVKIFVDSDYGKPLPVDPDRVFTNQIQAISVGNLCSGDELDDTHLLEIYVTDTSFLAAGESQRNITSPGRREHVVRLFTCD